jgi:adenine-specific DNA-methyltransferase
VISAPPDPTNAKAYGAFYTPIHVAHFLVQWAVRSKTNSVLDPSYGGGVFLQAAHARISALGGKPEQCVFGIELDAIVHATTSQALRTLGLPTDNFLCSDFFAAIPDRLDRFDAVVGNPPFIRYQQFNGAARNRANELMSKQGVRVSELASSWAPFVVCAGALLRTGGRLAMVVPMELCHATYARPVLEYLSLAFRKVQFLSFSERLFPELSQETLLLLGEDKGNHSGADFRFRHLGSSEELFKDGSVPRTRRLDAEALVNGRQRLIEQFMPARTRELYLKLRRHEAVRPLGDLADVGIGYVTGANDFFHLSEAESRQWEIPSFHLQAAVCRGRALTGLRFTKVDWANAQTQGDAAYLLTLPRAEKPTASVRRYLRHGEEQEVHKAYKCRVRDPWYHVPHVYRPDAFLTYMTGICPRLVVNEATAVAPNTLHVVRMLPLAGITAEALAVAWRSSLTELSSEIEGHALGGGMLKLEPSEARRVLVALPAAKKMNGHCQALDVLARHTVPETVRDSVDRFILQDHLGLTERECRRLREATAILRARRLVRSKRPCLSPKR